MNRKKLFIVGSIVVLGVMAGALIFTRTPDIAAKADNMTDKGNDAPAFSLKDTEGTVHTLADYKGEKVYIKFWASWCSICLAGLEDVDKLSAEDSGFKVITIASPGFNGEQSHGDFIQWFGGLEMKNMTVLLDEGGDIARAYGVRAYPTSAFIDSEGILIKSAPGHMDNESIKETVKGMN